MNMNGFFHINPYYNDIKQEIVVPYAAGTNAAPVTTLPAQGVLHTALHQPPTDSNGCDGPGALDKAVPLSKSQRRFLHESPEARAKRLARNAERMRQKRASESEEEYRRRMAQNAERMRKKRAAETEEEYRRRMERNTENKLCDEYQRRLAKNAERNRRRRQNETDMERSIRRARSAARERLRRAMETPEQRAVRLTKLAERMRYSRANESPEQRAIRLAKNAAKAKERLFNETPEQWIERKRKKAEYARQKRSAAATVAKLGLSVTCSSSSSTSSTSVSTNGDATFSQPPHTTYSLDLNQPIVQQTQTTMVDVKDLKLISPHKVSATAATAVAAVAAAGAAPQTIHLPEQLYASSHIPFPGADLKPPEFLTSGSNQHGQPLVQPDLYKFHLLPYTFSPTAGAVHPTQAEYKSK